MDGQAEGANTLVGVPPRRCDSGASMNQFRGALHTRAERQ
jgi:hypothetical protein